MLSKIFLGYITVKQKNKKKLNLLLFLLSHSSLSFFLKPIPFPLSLYLPHSLPSCTLCSFAFGVSFPLTSLFLSHLHTLLLPFTLHFPLSLPTSIIFQFSIFFLSILTILIKDVKNSYWKSSHKHVISLHLQQTFPVSQGLGSSAGLSYTPYLTPMSHSMGLVPTDILPSTPVIVPGSPPVSMTAGSSSNQKLLRTDKLEVTHPIRILLHGT